MKRAILAVAVLLAGCGGANTVCGCTYDERTGSSGERLTYYYRDGALVAHCQSGGGAASACYDASGVALAGNMLNGCRLPDPPDYAPMKLTPSR